VGSLSHVPFSGTRKFDLLLIWSLDRLSNEAYLVLSFNLGGHTRIHLGGAAAAQAENGSLNAFAGVERHIGHGLFIYLDDLLLTTGFNLCSNE